MRFSNKCCSVKLAGIVERKLLERYFDNSCTAEERERVLLWLSDERNKSEIQEHLADLWMEFNHEGESVEELDYVRLKEYMEARGKGKIEKADRNSASRQGPKRNWWYVAAAIIGFVLAGSWLIWRNWAPHEDKLITVITEKGERKLVKLSDGSEVYLNAESKFTYPEKIKAEQAVVYQIEGEAFFKMAESSGDRLIKTGDIVTKASNTATSINVSAFPQDSVVVIAIENGKAEINDNGKYVRGETLETDGGHGNADSPASKTRKSVPITRMRPVLKMDRYEYAVISKDKKQVDISAMFDEKEFFGWKEGIIYFREAGSEEIARKLERWYNVNVNFCKGLKTLPLYSGEFDNSELTTLLTELSSSLQLNYKIEGKDIYLCSK